ncbi:protein mono-ADP-ribosyltransferase PARP3-like [Ruditapes philippinarum]|uniref:protein mono-ADP-ribosyltransferase PARP3-like n=1 Tax=Ruditapes philippinarum TaxID=129788 RepID=UPI00295BF5B8|nr:protein mono-ADP-ribosyltransferase PARP3-like [Ruditapes philippinarum]
MPPKRKAAGAGAKGGKKAKTEAPATPKTMKDAAAALKAEDKKSGGKKSHKIDSCCTLGSGEIVDDYDCMLNQTNIGHNNNKFYVIQVIQDGGSYYTWNRWGRVGEKGANSLTGPTDLASAVKAFEKKFKDKTKNNWAQRGSFNPVAGKYTLIEMADDDEDDAPGPSVSLSTAGKKVAGSKLDKTTQGLLKLLFDNDMFKDCMKKFDIDVKKMPLGKLSKGQIAKGFEVLDEIEKVLDKKGKGNINELSSKFYTVIPHDFGRNVPPPINTLEKLRQRMDMLLVLGDIEIAQSMKKEKDKQMEAEKGDMLPNPIDVEYGLLNCDLELVDKKSDEFKKIQTYTSNTSGSGYFYRGNAKIKDVWKVGRIGEDKRFKEHDKITNRKLLWHGTNVAVVAAILKSGLRIMPHSGGRVGAGIYFASENSKSAGYVGTVGKTGIMFLNEVALGKEKHVATNQSHLKAAPAGYDCVIAQGNNEPDPKQHTTLTLDGKKVVVPQGKPIPNPGWSHSHFDQSEYLIYKESQNRIRYLLLCEF